jgi:hypothetical protein
VGFNFSLYRNHKKKVCVVFLHSFGHSQLTQQAQREVAASIHNLQFTIIAQTKQILLLLPMNLILAAKRQLRGKRLKFFFLTPLYYYASMRKNNHFLRYVHDKE